MIGTWRRTVASGEYDSAFQDQSAGFEVILAACLFLLARQNLNRPCRPLARSGLVPLLLPVYFLHAVLLQAFGSFGFSPGRFPTIVGGTVLIFLLSWLLAKTFASIRPLCYVFTGMPYGKACESCNWQWTLRRLREGKN